MTEMKSSAMASVNNCGVCARPLVYATESVLKTCNLCGKEAKTAIYCPAGYYVCDACHQKAALEVLKQVLAESRTADPAAILEQVISHPSVPMHVPEHHVIVPAAIVTAVRNSGYPLPEGAVDKAIERTSKVPAGWRGLYGDCGAAVGAGIAVSVITGATPLADKQRTLPMAYTSEALSRMLDERPRCGKRASRIAIQSTVDFLRKHLSISLPFAQKVK
jgi:hypothetical protein